MKKTSLIILDGVGINDLNPDQNSVSLASTPNLDKLFGENKYSSLEASGKAVGVTDGQIGNSEVGHLTIGSGRIIKQSVVEINELFDNEDFENLEVFRDGIDNCRKNNSKINIIGLLGPGGVHGHTDHILNTIKLIPEDVKVSVHLIGDGRDLSYNSMLGLFEKFSDEISGFSNVNIGSISGRYFAMDRDNNRDRIEKAYNAIVLGKNISNMGISGYIEDSYKKGVYDEFIDPVCFGKDLCIEDLDSVFFMNFRSDRARQLTQAIIGDFTTDLKPQSLTSSLLEGENLKDIYFVSMTKYYGSYDGLVFLEKKDIKNTLGEIIQDNGLKQLHIAETEKYAHVTKFFNGGSNIAFTGEKDILIPSHKVVTYDLDPEMSAYEILSEFEKNVVDYDFSVVNFANGDMVGHTGNMNSAIKAVETLDDIVGKLIYFSEKNDIDIIITADHGNCEEMGTKENPVTSHTLNKVPCFYISSGKQLELKKEGGLKDIATTILDIMGIEKLDDMCGESLVK